MGLCAYIFPILLFAGVTFLIVNNTNRLAYKKVLAGVVFFVFLCGFLQLITEGYTPSTTFSDYYSLSSEYRTGGGVFGGAVCISTASAFGVVGGTVIIVLVLLVSLIIITQRSFFGFMNKILDFFTDAAREGKEAYLEGQPDREKQKELRRKIRAEKRAEKIRRLEEELEEEELALTEEDPENISKKQRKKPEKITERRQAAVRGLQEEFNLPSFLDEQKAVLPADTELTEEDPGACGETGGALPQPLESQIHRSHSRSRRESRRPDFGREMRRPKGGYLRRSTRMWIFPRCGRSCRQRQMQQQKLPGKQERQPFSLR